MKKLENFIEYIIFASRWIQVPFYVGLIVGTLLFAYQFTLELIHLVHSVGHASEEVLIVGVLTLVDITMIGNLLVMVIIGGYATFVSRLHIKDNEDRPDWLEKIDAGAIKVKTTGSLVLVSGIHLLRSFMNINEKSIEVVKWQIIIHITFLFSTLILAYSEKIMHSQHQKKH